MFTHYFIARPILSAVISILILIGGALSMLATPVEQYPDMAPPQVTVSASYPGATADVIAQTVAAPIEAQLNGIDNLLYFYSNSSSSGNVSINVLFTPGSDPDINQVNVQNRVSQAMSQLPQAVVQKGVTVESQSSSMNMVVSVFATDERFDSTFVDNYTNLYVLDELKRVPGANRASVLGLPDIAMRIWLRPDLLAQFSMSTDEVARAIQSQNQTFGIGQLGASPTLTGVQQNFVVTAQGMLTNPDEFSDIIIRTDQNGAAIVRLRDVGRVELAKLDYSVASRMNGKIATTIAIYQQPGANAIQTSKLVRARLDELKKQFPDGLDYRVVNDSSVFTIESIDKVVHTFFEAVVLVVLVVFIFLQSLRATIIPILAVPISIIGAFIGMHALGYHINMLTLFGLILAIGLVVDDAIVVVESVEENMQKHGLSPFEAAKRAMSEIAGALISIVLVLLAVFIPTMFLGGVTGTLYKQFAVTVAVSIVISGIVALTLSPALAALVLKNRHAEKKGFFLWFENTFEGIRQGYLSGVRWVLRHKLIGFALYLGVILAIVGLFRLVPSSFVPDEDQGYFFVVMQTPDASSAEVVKQLSSKVENMLLQHPAVQDVGVVDGYSLLEGQVKNNASLAFVLLKPFAERTTPELSSFSVVPHFNAQFSQFKDGIAFAINPPSIPGLGTTGGFEFYLQNRGAGDTATTQKVLQDFLAQARQRPELQGVNTTFNAYTQQLFVDLDRSKAELLDVPVADVFQTMQALFGSQIVGQFSQYSRIWWVVIQADAAYRVKPSDFEGVYIKSRRGEMVPLSALMTTRYIPAPKLLTRFNGYPAVKITGDAAPGFSSGQAIAAMQAVAHETLPNDFAYAWAGQALQEIGSGNTSTIAFIFGLIVVFLLLAAKFEKWSLPLAVVFSVPFAILGALLITWARGMENDVYFQVGLVILVGLSAKNAILIVEFAIERVRAGMDTVEAVVEAAGLRLRAIVMTSLAFILGVVPLAIATGPGANSLHAIGTGVIGGMLFSTLIATFFVPLFFVTLEDMGKKAKPAQEAEHEA
ncbi:MAG: multidrug efflux RND transporter permease subunit [Pseudomonadota bacterium]